MEKKKKNFSHDMISMLIRSLEQAKKKNQKKTDQQFMNKQSQLQLKSKQRKFVSPYHSCLAW